MCDRCAPGYVGYARTLGSDDLFARYKFLSIHRSTNDGIFCSSLPQLLGAGDKLTQFKHGHVTPSVFVVIPLDQLVHELAERFELDILSASRRWSRITAQEGFDGFLEPSLMILVAVENELHELV